MKRWIEVTAFEGIREINDARRKHPCRVVVWMIIMGAMFCSCTHSVAMSIKDYIRSPTMTSIATVSESEFKFPDILLCYNGGYNARKMSSVMNLSENLIAALSNDFELKTTGFEKEKAFESSQAANEFDEFLRSNQLTIERFYEEISFNCSNIIKSRYIFNRNNLGNKTDACENVKRIMLEYYAPRNCLLFTNIGNQMWPGVEGGLRLKVAQPAGSMAEIYPDILQSDFLLELHTKFVSPNFKRIKVPKYTEVELTIKPTKHKRLKGYGTCVSNGDSSSSDCYGRCLALTRYNVCRCHFIADKPADPNSVCNFFSYRTCRKSKNPVIHDNVASCVKSCQPVCDEWEYDYSLSTTTSAVKNTEPFDVTIAYNSLEYAQIEQVSSFTFDMAVGNVGGIAGLYLGCSVVSIFQLIYYIVLHCIDKEQNK